MEAEWMDAVAHYVRGLIANANTSPFLYATFEVAEPADTNLSKVLLADGTRHRGVPKLASAGTLTAGDIVLLMVDPNKPMTIIGKVVGDRTVTLT